jgi:hypothetical protein
MPKTWVILLFSVMLVVDAIAFHQIFFRIRPLLKKLGRTMAERKEALAAAEVIVGECLRESYSGDPDTLPAVIAGIAPRLDDLLVRRGLEPDRDAVRELIARSLATHGVPAAQAREALTQLAS